MPRLPSRPDDPCCQSARSQLLAGHQRHIMIQPTRLLIDLAQNSNPSSQRNRLVTQSSEPFAVAQESHVLPLCSTGEFFQRQPTKFNRTITRSLLSLWLLRFIKQNP